MDRSDFTLKQIAEKFDEIVKWINNHEKNPPWVKPPVYG